jgi:hypothetical protein
MDIDVDSAPTWVLTNKEKAEWCSMYHETSKFPSMHVPCNQCGSAITMFSCNLRNRIKKFSTPENLLNTFVCVRCVRKNNSLKPYELKQHTKKAKKAQLALDVPIVTYSTPVEYSSTDLASNPDLCKKMTDGNCWKPALYLDNGKHCHGDHGDCNLFENCGASIKRK